VTALFLSDLHFTAESEPRCRRLLDFLRAEGPAVDAIYLVGDVFDFWLGYRHTVYSAYFPLLRVLADLVDDGVRVVLFSGNHDPDPGGFFQQIGIEVQEGALTERFGPLTVRMEHGDTVDPRGWLRAGICKAVRHPWARGLARTVPPAVLWYAAGIYAHKPHGDHGPGLPRGLSEDYFPAQVEAGVDVLIMGHYHRAAHFERLGPRGTARYFVLGDWRAQFTYLRYMDGRFELMRHRPDAADHVLPIGDHAP
jgi:UDP-2,3-diacylglucosamine hydrolase